LASALGFDFCEVKVFLASFLVFLLSFVGENTDTLDGWLNRDPYLSLVALVGLNSLLFSLFLVEEIFSMHLLESA
jgi:hypothetical protein